EPAQLVDIVRGRRLAVAADEPGEPEHEVVLVRLEVRAAELDRLDLDSGLLAELPLEPVDRVLALLEEAAGDVPVPLPRLALPSGEEHPALALEQAFGGGRRVGPVAGA